VGGLSGAGTMLLLAPQSGKKMRAQIQKKSKALRKQTTRAVEDVLEQVRDKAHEITAGVHDQAEALGQRGQDAIGARRDHLGQSLKDLGKAVHT
jgi:gas vesicle protein